MTGGNCLFWLLIIWVLMELNSWLINPMSWEISLYKRFYLIFKEKGIFHIVSLILCFTTDLYDLYSFSRWLCKLSYSKISILSFKIIKVLHLSEVLYSVYLYTFELSFFSFEILNLYFLLIIICFYLQFVSLISILIFSSISNKIF